MANSCSTARFLVAAMTADGTIESSQSDDKVEFARLGLQPQQLVRARTMDVLQSSIVNTRRGNVSASRTTSVPDGQVRRCSVTQAPYAPPRPDIAWWQPMRIAS